MKGIVIVLTTTEAIEQFDEAFRKHDPAGLTAIIADDCILENTGPAPDGAVYKGKDACISFWSDVAANTAMHFDTENIDILDDRAIIKWRLTWGTGKTDHVRGVNIMRVKEGKVIEALGYVKS